MQACFRGSCGPADPFEAQLRATRAPSLPDPSQSSLSSWTNDEDGRGSAGVKPGGDLSFVRKNSDNADEDQRLIASQSAHGTYFRNLRSLAQSLCAPANIDFNILLFHLLDRRAQRSADVFIFYNGFRFLR